MNIFDKRGTFLFVIFILLMCISASTLPPPRDSVPTTPKQESRHHENIHQHKDLKHEITNANSYFLCAKSYTYKIHQFNITDKNRFNCHDEYIEISFQSDTYEVETVFLTKEKGCLSQFPKTSITCPRIKR